jgi:AAA family ATP:ADP antiporter
VVQDTIVDPQPGSSSVFAPLRERSVRLATVAFFCLLAGYYVLRPIREEMGIAGGVEQLPWMYTATFVAITVAVVPISWAVSRWRRRVVVPGLYVAAAVGLVVTFALAQRAHGPAAVWVARGLYVAISTFNMFAVSLFWALMSDVMTTAQSKRNFGMIAAGGSAGAIVGPAVTGVAAPVHGPIAMLMLAAGLLSLAALATWRVAVTADADADDTQTAPVTGSLVEGLRRIVRSRQLAGICAYVALYATTSTLLYFAQAHIVKAAIADSGVRTSLFATMDLVGNVLALLVQAGLLATLVRRFGLAVLLTVLPLLTVVAFGALAFAPVLVVLVVVQVARRATSYSMARPAREILFTGVDRTERYKSKVVIDTVVYRGSDAAAGWAFAALIGLGMALPGVALLGVLVALGWAGISRDLGRRAVAARDDA